MRHDKFDNVIYDEKDMIALVYRDQLDCLPKINCEPTTNIEKLSEISDLKLKYINEEIYNLSVEDFDNNLQKDWFIPEEYKNLDIISLTIDQCQNDLEVTRAREELDEYQKRNMIPLLQWLKYLVDTCRKNNIVLGVGRGSSVSSFVLFLIGVHKIDSIKYNLDWQDFLR